MKGQVHNNSMMGTNGRYETWGWDDRQQEPGMERPGVNQGVDFVLKW